MGVPLYSKGRKIWDGSFSWPRLSRPPCRQKPFITLCPAWKSCKQKSLLRRSFCRVYSVAEIFTLKDNCPIFFFSFLFLLYLPLREWSLWSRGDQLTLLWRCKKTHPAAILSGSPIYAPAFMKPSLVILLWCLSNVRFSRWAFYFLNEQ